MLTYNSLDAQFDLCMGCIRRHEKGVWVFAGPLVDAAECQEARKVVSSHLAFDPKKPTSRDGVGRRVIVLAFDAPCVRGFCAIGGSVSARAYGRAPLGWPGSGSLLALFPCPARRSRRASGVKR